MSAPRYRKIDGHWYVLATYMGERMNRVMEIARYDGMIEGARARADCAKQQINALEPVE
jgi:hypothetical protein